MNIPVSEFRRMARESMKGRFAYLTLIAAVASLPGLDFFPGRLTAPVIAALVALQLLAALLGYGQQRVFLRRFRGEPDGPGLLWCLPMLPKLALLFLLRDAVPTALLEVAARMSVTTYRQLTRASGFQLAGFALQALMVYNYGMAEYLLVLDPARSTLDAMRTSRRTLSGNRLRLLVLSLSFICWVLLARVPDLLVGELLPNLYPLVRSLLSLLWTAPVLTYVSMSQTAFFEVIAGHRAVADAYDTYDAPFNAPAAPATPRPVMTAREAAAWDMLDQHGFSHDRLEADGELDAYRALNISPEKEARWRADWLDQKLDGYEADPDGMDDALRCAAEFADAGALRRAVSALDDALTSGQVIEGMIARQTLALAKALNGGPFDPEADWAQEIKTAANDLSNRLENRLTKIDPNGSWRNTIDAIRELTV